MVSTTRQRWLATIFVAAALLHLLPIWRVEHIPTIDGPSHLYNAQVLRELAAGTPAFGRVFAADLRPYPNWLGHALLWLALAVAPPLVAEKLVVSAIVLLFLGGSWRLAGLVDRGSRVYAFLVMPLAFHLLLQMGFYNYSLGVGLMPFAIASWWRGRERGGWRPGVATALWLVLCYFAHVVPAAMALACITVAWIFSRGWKGRWQQLTPLIPAALLLSWFLLQPKLPGGDWTWDGALLWQPLLRVGLLFTFDLRQLTFGTVLGALFGVLIAITFLLENVDWQRRRLVVRERDVFLLLAVLAAALYLLAPIGVQEGLVLKARMLPFPYLLVLPWLTPRLGRLTLAVALAVLAVANVFFIRDAWKRNAALFTDAVAPLSAAQPLRTLVPLVFDRSTPHAHLGLLGHAVSYGATERRLVDLGNYEAALGFFPVAFRTGVRRPAIAAIETAPGEFDPSSWAEAVDYIYTWKMPPGAPLEGRLRERYELLAEAGAGRLYGRKGSQPAP